MKNKILAIQGDSLKKINPESDTSIFLANEIQKKKYKIFYYEPKNLSIINKNNSSIIVPNSERSMFFSRAISRKISIKSLFIIYHPYILL